MTDTEITTGELAARHLAEDHDRPQEGFLRRVRQADGEPGLKLRGRAETKDHALLAPPGQCQRQGARAGVECAMTDQSENVWVSALRERP